MKKNYFLFLFVFIQNTLCVYGQQNEPSDSDYLLLNYSNESYSYVNKNGKVIIPPEKYLICFTDTFRNYAIVLDQENGFIGIDRNQNMLFKVFVFDNGPDYVSEGLFRYKADNKIGFVCAKTGKIQIEAKYMAAYPFDTGKASVSLNCKTKQIGEHVSWDCEEWFYIDKNGEIQP